MRALQAVASGDTRCVRIHFSLLLRFSCKADQYVHPHYYLENINLSVLSPQLCLSGSTAVTWVDIHGPKRMKPVAFCDPLTQAQHLGQNIV